MVSAATAADAAETTAWVGLAVWGLALVTYLVRSSRAARRNSAPTEVGPQLPTTTMAAIGVAEFAANVAIMVVEPVGRIPAALWWLERLLPVVFWPAMTILVIVFAWQSRRRLLWLSTRLCRYEYTLALEERRSRIHAALAEQPGTVTG